MKQKNQRLIDEIGKLIHNILSQHGDIYLPQIGTLRVAEGDGKGSRSLAFETTESGHSIVEMIAQRGNCSTEQAEKVYKRWFTEVNEGGRITLEGIGEIEGRSFTPCAELMERLNPTPSPKAMKPKEVAKGGSNRLAWAVAVVLALAIIAIALVIVNNRTKRATTTSVVVVEQVESAPEETKVTEIATEKKVAATPPAPEQSEKITELKTYARQADSEVALSCFKMYYQQGGSSKRYRVACGVLNSRVNAGRLALDASILSGTDHISLRIYPRHDGYMVVLFESDRFRECYNFIKQNSAQLYDSMWIYDDKKM